MRKIYFFFLFTLILINSKSYIFSDENNKIVTKISRKKIMIGEKIKLTVKISNLLNTNILWEEMSSSHSNVEIYSKNSFYKSDILNLEIIFSFFDEGTIKDFTFTIPLVSSEGELLYLNTSKYTIKVVNQLSEEEISNIKNIKDPSKIELKKEKKQAKIPYKFSFHIKIIILIIFLIFFGSLLYYILYKIIKKKLFKDKNISIPPFDDFLREISIIDFLNTDDRKTIENKLSYLTEILKKLIYKEFSFNAVSETTTELIFSLRNINFKEDIITDIQNTLMEIDLIKFAKGNFDIKKLKFFIKSVKELGINIHNYKLSIDQNNIIN